MKPTAQNQSQLQTPQPPPPNGQNRRQPQRQPQRHRAALHMATTLSALLSLPSAWPSLRSASSSSNSNSPETPTPPASNTTILRRLGELSARHPDLAPHLTREMALRARRFMNGVTLYRNHPARRAPDTAPVIWQSGTTVLRDYAPAFAAEGATARQAPANAPIVLIVPSLVNRYGILDLHPQHSFLRLLAANGLRPLIVDWDAPGEDEKNFSLGDYVTQRLVAALQVASAAGPVHILGYCMGGLLALALAQLCPQQTRSLSLLATPWDFHAGYEAAGQQGWNLEDKLKAWLATDDLLPVDVIQGVFASFQPMHALRKFSNFAACDQSGADAERFVLTEDWLNDGVALTASAARECFGDFSNRNVTAKNEWKVGGQIIDPRQITAPAYVVVPGRDRIVPPESAMPLARAIPHAMRHEPMLGHIGIMVSVNAPHQVWKPFAGWLVGH